MSLDHLIRVVRPPAQPAEVGSSWGDVENMAGTRQPKDYKDLVTAFGTGCFDEFLWVFNPFSQNRHLNFFEQLGARLRSLRELQAKWGSEEVSYPLFPEPGGLLPWGASDNGDVM